MSELDLEKALDVARRAAQAASQAALPYFRAGVTTRTKEDRSPVTQADLESEAAIVRVIREAFPDHSLLTEESGAHAGLPETRWIVDPLDGTRGFIRGGVFWGALIALEHKGEIVAGAMALPAQGLLYWAARGLGAWRDGTRLTLAPENTWAESTVSCGEISRMLRLPEAERLKELLRTCASARAYGDVGSIAMLLDGRADAWIEGGVQPWDLAPGKILVEEAGGVFTDFSGRSSPAHGSALAARAGLHRHMVATVSPGSR